MPSQQTPGLSPSSRALLGALRQAKGHNDSITTFQAFQAAGLGFRQRMMDLREAGYVIETIIVPVRKSIAANGKRYRYRLISEPKRG